VECASPLALSDGTANDTKYTNGFRERFLSRIWYISRLLFLPGCQNHFGMDDRGDTACQKQFLPDNKTISAQEILIEEIRRQPEPVAREVLHYLKFLERQRAQEDWADVIPSREVEQEKLDLLDGK
jgi:hypothetical protein